MTKNFATDRRGGYRRAAALAGDQGHRQPPGRRGRSARCGRRARSLFVRRAVLHRDRAVRSPPREAPAGSGRGARPLRQHLLAELPARRAHPPRAARRRARDLREAARHQSVEPRCAAGARRGDRVPRSARCCSCACIRSWSRCGNGSRADGAPASRRVSDLHHRARAAGITSPGRARTIAPAASSPTSAFTCSICCCGCSVRVRTSEVHLREPQRAAGVLELERADVRWFLSTERRRPAVCAAAGREGDLPLDHGRRRRGRVQRRLRRSAHAGLRGGAGRTRLRHR